MCITTLAQAQAASEQKTSKCPFLGLFLEEEVVCIKQYAKLAVKQSAVIMLQR